MDKNGRQTPYNSESASDSVPDLLNDKAEFSTALATWIKLFAAPIVLACLLLRFAGLCPDGFSCALFLAVLAFILASAVPKKTYKDYPISFWCLDSLG